MTRQYRFSVPIVAALIVVIVTLILLETGSRLLFANPNDLQLRLTSEIRNKLNSPRENDPNLPLYLPRQGGDCMRQDSSGLRWHARFGFNSKTLDSECAHRLFSSASLKVLMFGGSTMANVGAVNYLTSLDYLAFGDKKDI